ncbi:hypothetical protein LJR290_003446 [Variovorax sp. LjRoot290]
MPPFPTSPSRDDWWEAATTLYTVPSWWKAPMTHADPLGRIAARARDIMRNRHCNSPEYAAFLAAQDAERRAAVASEDAERARRNRAKTAKDWAEEYEFFAEGGTEEEWEAIQQAKAAAARDRATQRLRRAHLTKNKREIARITRDTQHPITITKEST